MFSQKNTAGNVQTQSQEVLDRVNRSRDDASTVQDWSSYGYSNLGIMNDCNQSQDQFAQNNYNSVPNNYQSGPNNNQELNSNQGFAQLQQLDFNQNQNFNRGAPSFSQPQGHCSYSQANFFNQGHNQNFFNQNQGFNGHQCMNGNGNNATFNSQQCSAMQQTQWFNGQQFNTPSNLNGLEHGSFCSSQGFNCGSNGFNQGSGPDNCTQNLGLHSFEQKLAVIEGLQKVKSDPDYDPDNPNYSSRLDNSIWDFCLEDDFPKRLAPCNNPFYDPTYDDWLCHSFSISSDELREECLYHDMTDLVTGGEPSEEDIARYRDFGEEEYRLREFEDALYDLELYRRQFAYTLQIQAQDQGWGDNQSQEQGQNWNNNLSQMQQQRYDSTDYESAQKADELLHSEDQDTFFKLNLLGQRYGVEDIAREPASISVKSAQKAEASPRPEIKDPIQTLEHLDQRYSSMDDAQQKLASTPNTSDLKSEDLSRPYESKVKEQIQAHSPKQGSNYLAQVNAKLDALANPQIQEQAQLQIQEIAQIQPQNQVQDHAQSQVQAQVQVAAQENNILVEKTSTESVYNALIPAENMKVKPDNAWGHVIDLEVFGMHYTCPIGLNIDGRYGIDFTVLRGLDIGRGLSIGSQRPSFYDHFYATPRELEFYSALTLKNGFLRRVCREIANTIRNFQVSVDLKEQLGSVASAGDTGLALTVGYKETVPLCKVDLHMRSIGGGKLGYSLDSLFEIFQLTSAQTLVCLDLLHDHVGLDKVFYCPNDGDGFPALYVPSEVVKSMVARFCPVEANAILRKISDLDSGVYYKHQRADIAYTNEVAKDQTSLFTGLYATDPANYVYNNIEKKVLKSLVENGRDLSALGIELNQLPFTIVSALISLYLFKHRDIARKLDSVHQEYYIRRFACGFMYEPTAEVVKLERSFKTTAQLEASKKRSAKRAAAKAIKAAKEAEAKQLQAQSQEQIVTEFVAPHQELVAPSACQVTEAQDTIATNQQEEAQVQAETQITEAQVDVVDEEVKTISLTSTIASIEDDSVSHQATALTSQELMLTAPQEVLSNAESQLPQQTHIAVQGFIRDSQGPVVPTTHSATSFVAPVKSYDPFDYIGENEVQTPQIQAQSVSPVAQKTSQSAVAIATSAQDQQEDTQSTPQVTSNAPESKQEIKVAKLLVEQPAFDMSKVSYTENIDDINSQTDLSYQFYAKQLDKDSDFVCVFIPESNGLGPVNVRYPIYEDNLYCNPAVHPLPSFSHVELQKLMIESAPYCIDMVEMFSDISCQAKLEGVKAFLFHNCQQKDLNDSTLNATGEKPMTFHEAMDRCILVPEMPPYRVKLDEHLFVYIERRFEQTSLEAYVDDLCKRLAFLGEAFVRDLSLLYRLAYNEGLDWAGKNFGLQTLLRLQKVTPDYAKRLINEFDRYVNDIAASEHSRQVQLHKNYWSEIPEHFFFKAKKALESDLDTFGLQNVALAEGQTISSEQASIFAMPAELLLCKPWDQFFGLGQDSFADQAEQIALLSQQLNTLRDHVVGLSKTIDVLSKENKGLSQKCNELYEEAESYWRTIGNVKKELDASQKELDSSKKELNSTKEMLLASQEQVKQALALAQDKDAKIEMALASCQEYQERERALQDQLQAQSELIARGQAQVKPAIAQNPAINSSPNTGFAGRVRPEQAKYQFQTAQAQVQTPFKVQDVSHPQNEQAQAEQTTHLSFAQTAINSVPDTEPEEQDRPEQNLFQSQIALNVQSDLAHDSFEDPFQDQFQDKTVQTAQDINYPKNSQLLSLQSLIQGFTRKSSPYDVLEEQVSPEQPQSLAETLSQDVKQSNGQILSQAENQSQSTQNISQSNEQSMPKGGGMVGGMSFKIPAPKYTTPSQAQFKPKLKQTVDPNRAKSITQLEQALPKGAISFNGVEVHQFDLSGAFFSVPDIAPEFVLIPRAGVNTKKRKYGEALWLSATDRVRHEKVSIHQPSAIFCSKPTDDGYAQVPTVFTTLNTDASTLCSVEGRVVMEYKPKVDDGFNCDNLAGFTRVSFKPKTSGLELTRMGRSKPVVPVGLTCTCQCAYTDVSMGLTLLGSRTPYHNTEDMNSPDHVEYAAAVRTSATDAARLLHNRPLSDIRTYSEYFDYLPEELDFNQIQCDHLRYDFYRSVSQRYHGIDFNTLTPDQYIALLVDKMPFAHQLDLVLQEIAMLAFKEGLLMSLEKKAQESIRSNLVVVETFVSNNLAVYQKHFKECARNKQGKPFELKRSMLRPDIETTTWRDGYHGEWGYSFLDEAFVQKYYQTTSTHYVVCDMDYNCLLVPSPNEKQSLEDYISSLVPLLRFGKAFWDDVRTMTLLAREDAERWVGDHPDITIDKILNSFANFVGAAFQMRLKYFNHHLFEEYYSLDKANSVKANQADEEMFDIVRIYLEEDMSLDSRGVMNSNNLQTVVSLFVQRLKQSDLAAQLGSVSPTPEKYVPLNSPVASIDNVTTAYGNSRQLVKNAMFEVSRLALAEGVFDMFIKSQVFFLLVALKRLTASIFSKLDVYTDRACGYKTHSDDLIKGLQCLPNWFEKDSVNRDISKYSSAEGVQKTYDRQQEFPLNTGICVTVPPVRPGCSASDFIASFVNKPYQYQVDNWTYVKLYEIARASYYNGFEWTRYNSTSFIDTAIESFNNHFLPQMQGYLEFFVEQAAKYSLPKGRPKTTV